MSNGWNGSPETPIFSYLKAPNDPDLEIKEHPVLKFSRYLNHTNQMLNVLYVAATGKHVLEFVNFERKVSCDL
jgi:hypothetical protein